MRKTITWATVIGGLALMAVSYFALAAPWGNTAVRHSEPRLSFAPALFVVGVALLFGSALLYEVLPGRRRR